MTGDRRVHRARDIDDHVRLHAERRDVLDRDLHRVLESLGDDRRYALDLPDRAVAPARAQRAGRHAVGDHELVREAPCLQDRVTILELRGDLLGHVRHAEHALTGVRLQVDARLVPAARQGDLRPLLARELERGEHTELDPLGDVGPLALLERLELLDDLGQSLGVVLLAEDVAQERLLFGVLRLDVRELDDVREGRAVLADRRAEQGRGRARLDPVADQAQHGPLDALATEGARASHLDQVLDLLRVVDGAREGDLEQPTVCLREHDHEGRRHVLHAALLAGVDRGLRQELRGDLVRGDLDGLQLIDRRAVEGVVERTGDRELRERVLRPVLVGDAAGLVDGGCLGNGTPDGGATENALVCHGRPLLPWSDPALRDVGSSPHVKVRTIASRGLCCAIRFFLFRAPRRRMI